MNWNVDFTASGGSTSTAHAKTTLRSLKAMTITSSKALGAIYQEMVDRKKFAGQADIALFRRTQQALASDEKMWVILCKAQGEVIAGALFSALGDTAVDLFRATSNRGVKTYGSYLVQWKVLEHLKQRGCQYYNLNGINPARNPGGYQFKSQLAGKHGREVDFLGAFDTYPNAFMRLLTDAGEQVRVSLTRAVSRSVLSVAGCEHLSLVPV